MEQAEKGIRFIDPHYKELFRIPDGGQIRILGRAVRPSTGPAAILMTAMWR